MRIPDYHFSRRALVLFLWLVSTPLHAALTIEIFGGGALSAVPEGISALIAHR